ncbi:unnamed protein product [Cuscuta epithymum]|uniref:Uncharacterized protein n=1 Tax=Cuscuta epithymum TaxID=186058 RepID=A0AAV0CFZ4_9ASTE|nr:unnamed protein product [Cuscuta epithymum]
MDGDLHGLQFNCGRWRRSSSGKQPTSSRINERLPMNQRAKEQQPRSGEVSKASISGVRRCAAVDAGGRRRNPANSMATATLVSDTTVEDRFCRRILAQAIRSSVSNRLLCTPKLREQLP